MRALPAVVAVILGLAASGPWTLQESGTRARFRGLSAVSPQVAWASGSQGTCVRTLDGGASWKKVVVPDSDKLDFRDIQAFDGETAALLSIGPGELSRIYRTIDGGANWTLQHTNDVPKGFLDAISFWDARTGIALGDPVGGTFVILRSRSAGVTWSRIPNMPAALPGEGAFAASGTCLVTLGDSAWFGTGGGPTARVFRSNDRGLTWAVADTPIRAGSPSSGVFSLAFRDAQHGVAVGGDYQKPNDPTANLATTDDGGRTWTPATESRPSGFRSAVAYVPGQKTPTLVAVGPSGSDLSLDDGRTWAKLGDLGFHALGFGGSAEAGWAVGEDGQIGKFDLAGASSQVR